MVLCSVALGLWRHTMGRHKTEGTVCLMVARSREKRGPGFPFPCEVLPVELQAAGPALGMWACGVIQDPSYSRLLMVGLGSHGGIPAAAVHLWLWGDPGPGCHLVRA